MHDWMLEVFWHKKIGHRRIFLSAFLWNCFLCWDHGNGDMPPTLDMALLCSSKAGSDLGLESGLGYWSLCVLKFHEMAKLINQLFKEVIYSSDHLSSILFCLKVADSIVTGLASGFWYDGFQNQIILQTWN